MQRAILLIIIFFATLFPSLGQEADTLSREQRDSIRYTRLKKNLSRNKVTRAIYDLVFRDVYNKSKNVNLKEIEENPFEKYKGMTIGKITFLQLDVLGQSVYDTTRQGNHLQRFISRNLHGNTRPRIIKNTLLIFEEGDEIDPLVLQDNERLLRQSNILLDARIIVTPRKEPDWIADVLIVVQDVWSLNPIGGYGGIRNSSIGLDDINFLGQGQQLLAEVRWNSADSIQKVGFRTIYRIPYIRRSFISGEIGLLWLRDLKHNYIRFSRPFVTVNTKYAGGLDIGSRNVNEYKRFNQDISKVVAYPVANVYYDIWLGRAFKSPFGSGEARENSRITVALRNNQFHFLKRPEVRADTNMLYWNKSGLMLSLGFSSRRYKRDMLIYGFGRTEDVPVGSLFSLSFGREMTEFGERGYAGIQYATGMYLPRGLGYLYGLLNFGAYAQSGTARQGVIGARVNYFTPLINIGSNQLRQFINIRYTSGFNTDPVDYINISGENGIRGVFSEELIGNKRISMGVESVLFTNAGLFGFRMAPFVFADFGLVTLAKSIWTSPLYQGYGIGARFRNENLAINTFQVRIGFYPNIPAITSPWRYLFDGFSSLRLPDFDSSAPAVIPLQ